MKAVIVDLLNGQAAALRDDGRVVKLADAGYSLWANTRGSLNSPS